MVASDEPMTPERIRRIRESLGLTRSQFGRLLLGADARSAYGWVARLEEPERRDFTRPSRAVVVLLRWIEAGGLPPDWEAVVGAAPAAVRGSARAAAAHTGQAQGKRV